NGTIYTFIQEWDARNIGTNELCRFTEWQVDKQGKFVLRESYEYNPTMRTASQVVGMGDTEQHDGSTHFYRRESRTLVLEQMQLAPLLAKLPKTSPERYMPTRFIR